MFYRCPVYQRMNQKKARWILDDLQYYPERGERDYYNTCDFQCEVANVLCNCRLTKRTIMKYKDNLEKMDYLELMMGSGYWDIFYKNEKLLKECNVKLEIYY